MPVIAVAAAIGASVVAGSAVAATVGGIAAISAVTAFEVVAAVGATVAAVGAVTRDKTLTMVGGAIGLIGGIGGLASSAGVLGSVAASDAPIFGAAPAASTGVDTGATFADSLTPATAGGIGGGVESGTWDATSAAAMSADAASSNTIPFVANGIPEGQNDIQTFSSMADKATDPASTLANNTNPANALDTTQRATSGIDPATGLSSDTSADGLINQTPATAGSPTSAANPSTVDMTSTLNDGTTAASDSSKGMFGNILDFAKKNPTLVSGVLTVGGKFLEGMTATSLTPAQVQALQAQAAANNAAAALTEQQTRNLAMPKSVASSQPVTGTPGQIIAHPASGNAQPGGPGIINQAQLAPVTGAPR